MHRLHVPHPGTRTLSNTDTPESRTLTHTDTPKYGHFETHTLPNTYTLKLATPVYGHSETRTLSDTNTAYGVWTSTYSGKDKFFLTGHTVWQEFGLDSAGF